VKVIITHDGMGKSGSTQHAFMSQEKGEQYTSATRRVGLEGKDGMEDGERPGRKEGGRGGGREGRTK
jgi:hypothetical protein